MQTATVDLLDVDPWLLVADEEPFDDGSESVIAAKPVVAHLPGEHNQQSHGNDTASVSNALDKLKLGGKVKLREGERLLATDKARMSPDSEWRLAGAVLDAPAGRQVRLGIVGNPGAWDLGTSGGPGQANKRMDEIVREMRSLESDEDEEVVSDQARYDALRQELEDLEGAEFDQTVSLTLDAVAQFKTAIEGPVANAKAFTKAFNKFWDSDENAPILDEIMRLERERSQRGGPGLSPEDEARRVELQADVDRRSTEAGVYDTEQVFGTGVIPGVGGGADLGWRVGGTDDGEGGWQLTIAARPTDADGDWYPGSDEVGIKAVFESADIAGLNKFLGSLTGVRAAAPVVAHLPGQHDQSTHGRRGPKPEVPKAPRKAPAKKAEPPAKAAATKVTRPRKQPARLKTEDVGDAVKSGIVARQVLAGGSNSVTELVKTKSGATLVRKMVADRGSTTATRQVDAEDLGASLAAAVGAIAPRVHRQSDHEVFMEFMAGKLAMNATAAQRNKAIDTPAGRRLGLLDLMTQAWDRNSGNWIIDGDGNPVGIDHAFAFDDYPRIMFDANGDVITPNPFNPTFVTHFIEWRDNEVPRWKPNAMRPSEMAEIRRNLTALQPQFEEQGKQKWFNDALAVLDTVTKHAVGPEAVN